jgi:hypothetical protein
MNRRVVVNFAVAGLLSLAPALSLCPANAQSSAGQSKQEQKATKSISGKVTNIGSGGRSFTIDASGSTMEFLVDKNTQVNAQIKEGTAVTVEYMATDSGKNVAVSVTAQA